MKSNDVSSCNRIIGQLLIFSLYFLVVGCPAPKSPAPGTLSGKIVIKGSNTYGEELGPHLIEEYQKKQPGVTFETEARGTESGFSALLERACDIAAASRLANDNELSQARTRGIEFNTYAIGSYGVAVIVNKSNPIKGLSKAQIRDIFNGRIQNWQSVGGIDGPIRIYIRDPISGTYLGFRELAMENQPYAASARMFTNYANIVEAVAKDSNGIGYCSMSLAEQSLVRTLSVNGVPPGVLSVNEGQYPYRRDLWFYTNKTNESAATQDFIRFVQREPGQKVLEKMGYVRRFEPRLGTGIDD